MRRSLVIQVSSVAAAGVMVVFARLAASRRRVQPVPEPEAPAPVAATVEPGAKPGGRVMERVVAGVDVTGMVRDAQPVPPEQPGPG